MARKVTPKLKQHAFRNSMVLNKWLISLFGIDPLTTERSFRKLTENIRDGHMEGLGADNLHNFYHNITSSLIWDQVSSLSKDQLLAYEQNIVRHTQAINVRRKRPVIWKYFQWLTLLFTEIYLDRYFSDKAELIKSLNAFIDRYNTQYPGYAPIDYYADDDCNKLCLQNATGSGKTLLMHVNVLQYADYAKKHGRDNELSRIILITTNEQLSSQHMTELRESGLQAQPLSGQTTPLSRMEAGLRRIDVMEITKLAEKDGVNQIAARSLGDENLLLVDEAHRGMSGSDEGVWFRHRAALCAKGFTFEYSATFEQAVAASKSRKIENSYIKNILFDYSYRWFYEDGFGKDYSILNLPKSYDKVERLYLTACLLKFYQQMRIYQDKGALLTEFNLEKPLWVFVGSTVTGKSSKNDFVNAASDVARIVHFLAQTLADPQGTRTCMEQIVSGVGQDTGLMDEKNGDIFRNGFSYLADLQSNGENIAYMHSDLLRRVFNNQAGGHLVLSQIKGDSGEIALRAGNATEPFGLISVGDAKGLCKHIETQASADNAPITVEESEFNEAMFASVKESSSPVTVLIGSKKFVEGWDCWRVSTMGLMHVGKNEGAQIIQLFGRGVRLKGRNWCLKRSSETGVSAPAYLRHLETLNVFGIAADFMKRFHDFLSSEGLPGNQERQHIFIPLTVTYDFGKRLLVPKPKNKRTVNGETREYDFKKDGKVPSLDEQVPHYILENRVVADWYPRIQAIDPKAHGALAGKNTVMFTPEHLALLDMDQIYFALEQHKRERSWYNFNISKSGIASLLAQPDWYLLYMPTACLKPQSFQDIRLLQNVAIELLKRYCDSYYNCKKREYLEPRMEYRELTARDALLPIEDEYMITVDATEAQVVNSVLKMRDAIAANRSDLSHFGDLFACNFSGHLYQPLFFARKTSDIAITPVALNESEFTFIKQLKDWCTNKADELLQNQQEVFVLRNMSRGKGLGFFEAGGFYPDFIRWDIVGSKQYVSFIEPHGIMHEGIDSPKVKFHKQIKDIEKRLGDTNITLNSFILSWSMFRDVAHWGVTKQEFENNNVLFMRDDADSYLNKLQGKIVNGRANATHHTETKEHSNLGLADSDLVLEERDAMRMAIDVNVGPKPHPQIFPHPGREAAIRRILPYILQARPGMAQDKAFQRALAATYPDACSTLLADKAPAFNVAYFKSALGQWPLAQDDPVREKELWESWKNNLGVSVNANAECSFTGKIKYPIQGIEAVIPFILEAGDNYDLGIEQLMMQERFHNNISGLQACFVQLAEARKIIDQDAA